MAWPGSQVNGGLPYRELTPLELGAVLPLNVAFGSALTFDLPWGGSGYTHGKLWFAVTPSAGIASGFRCYASPLTSDGVELQGIDLLPGDASGDALNPFGNLYQLTWDDGVWPGNLYKVNSGGAVQQSLPINGTWNGVCDMIRINLNCSLPVTLTFSQLGAAMRGGN